MKSLEYFLIPAQRKLFKKLCWMFQSQILAQSKGNFILVKGEVPILLVAHLDTVHKNPVRDICASSDYRIFMSPQGIGGDDRCGVYALVNAYEMSAKKPYLLFTCDEEIGGVGASYFCDEYSEGHLPKELDNLKLIVEIDRKGSNDAVYYDCANEEFEKYITGKGFRTAVGSFSDISYIAPTLGVAAVNLSAGYHNPHQLCEYIDIDELHWTLAKVIEIITDAAQPDFPKYEYIPQKRYDDWFYSDTWGDGWGEFTHAKGSLAKKRIVDVDDGSVIEVKPLTSEDETYYYELIDGSYYTIEDLEFFREQYGDSVIRDLYIETFKPFVHEDFSEWDK